MNSSPARLTTATSLPSAVGRTMRSSVARQEYTSFWRHTCWSHQPVVGTGAMNMLPQPRFPVVTGLFTKLSRVSMILTLQTATIDTSATAFGSIAARVLASAARRSRLASWGHMPTTCERLPILPF
jgi:hypothetical protein